MENYEGPLMEIPGISVFETVLTFVLIPTALFLVISLLAYAATAPKKAKSSSLTTIE